MGVSHSSFKSFEYISGELSVFAMKDWFVMMIHGQIAVFLFSFIAVGSIVYLKLGAFKLGF